MVTALPSLLLLTAGVLVVLGIRGTLSAAALLRRTGCALSVAVILAVTPKVLDESPAAEMYLLAVPLALVLAVAHADMSKRRLRLVTTVAAVMMLAWGLVFVLGVGFAFLPSGLLLLTSAGLEARKVQIPTQPLSALLSPGDGL